MIASLVSGIFQIWVHTRINSTEESSEVSESGSRGKGGLWCKLDTGDDRSLSDELESDNDGEAGMAEGRRLFWFCNLSE